MSQLSPLSLLGVAVLAFVVFGAGFYVVAHFIIAPFIRKPPTGE